MSRYGNKCNVTACNQPHDAIPHRCTGHLYCLHCAIKINRANEPFKYEDGGLPFLREDLQRARASK